ncbi:alpha/beta hydrolase family protein [Saliphagus sp. GCM10025308]
MSEETLERGDSFVTESLTNWTPRFVANGIDYNDLARLEAAIDDWSEWLGAFQRVGQEYETLGDEAHDRGDEESAGDHYTRAAMYYHFGSHVWHEDDDWSRDVHADAVDVFRRGAELLEPPFERIEAPYDAGGFDVPANLRTPAESDDAPLVVLIPGLDSIKEELSTYAAEFHDRGLATLAVDGAGQGETWHEQGMTPEYPSLVGSVLDELERRDPDGVDTSRIGIYGVSLGGFYAPYVAANEDRIDACVGISGPFTVGPVSTRGGGLLAEQFEWACKTDSLIEVDEITEQLTLSRDVENLTVPTLVATGANDVIIHPRQSERIARRAPNGEFLLYDEGNHVCNNIPHKYRPRTADWLRAHLE